MLKKRDRLTTKDIENLSLGKSVFGTLLSLRFLAKEKTRISVSVSKKVFNTAVKRNKLRRRIYPLVTPFLKEIIVPAHILIMPKKECINALPSAIQDEIKTLLNKARLLR